MLDKALTRREFLWAAGLGAAGLSAVGRAALAAASRPATASAPAARRLNIIVLLADDLGYADLGCQGCPDIPTPHIDSIAAAGARFTQGYVSCPVCSPSRAGLLTGRYQTRFGHEFNFTPYQARTTDAGLPPSEATLADRLGALGYATGLVGKWHQGERPQYHPQKRGFDEFYGFLGGSRHYLATDKTVRLYRGSEEVKQQAEYLTDEFAAEAAAFIRRHKDHPFFLYLSFNAVHMPLQTLQKYLDRFAGKITDPKRLVYAGMLSAMDDAVGAVLAEVRQAGLERDTLVFFLSDNGGPTAFTTSRNDPLSGGKGQALEGGIRIPFLAQWPGRIPAGRTLQTQVISLDILPTALAAAGGALDPKDTIDGADILPLLTAQSDKPPHEALFWRFGHQWAVRTGNWKLVKAGPDDPTPARLFNLADDIGERTDLAAQQPEKLRHLQAFYDQWNARNAEPAWPSKVRKADADGEDLGD